MQTQTTAGVFVPEQLQRLTSKLYGLIQYVDSYTISISFSLVDSTIVGMGVAHGEFFHDILPLELPFLEIGFSIVQEFITADPKYFTFLEFLGQWNNVVLEESNFTIIPKFSRILCEVSTVIGIGHFFK